ncbi:Predicted membrane protein [uncultured Clostridium sp.]|uniref:TcaA 3rd/4th domain-containing protein n=1 Tax=uncultured Clostridium sp. TaxID=59620 RepID=UPI000821B92A|nr:hypothetical protein [uncultured Clostridium sp.]SCJ71972.1 Predicted membrane protein [uncultured Clostridium sp.]
MKEKFERKLSVFKEYLKKVIDKFNRLSLEKKIVIISIVIFVIFTFITANISSGASTKEEAISNFKAAIENKDEKLLSKTLKVDGEKVDSESLVPLIHYYYEKRDTLLDITKKLRAENKSGMLNIESKKNIFGEKYYLNVSKISLVIKSNFNNTEIFIGNRSIKAGEILKDIIPGTYIAKYKLNTDFGDVTGEEEITLIEDANINIIVDAGSITLYSDYKDADVFIDNKNIEKKVSSIVDFGPVPLNKDLNLYIEQEFPWGKIKSEAVVINSSGIIKVDIDMVNDKLMNEIEVSLNTFFNSVFDALNGEDKTLIQNADESTKNKIYDDIFKKTLFFTNNYEISDMSLNIEKSEFKYEDFIYKGNVVVKINYDIYKKILPFVKESRDETFLVGLVYDNGKWISNSIQRFNIYDE